MAEQQQEQPAPLPVEEGSAGPPQSAPEEPPAAGPESGLTPEDVAARQAEVSPTRKRVGPPIKSDELAPGAAPPAPSDVPRTDCAPPNKY